MTSEAIVGLGASILTAVCMLPQLIKIIRTRCAKDISYAMLAVLITGLGLWVVYGFLKDDWFIILSNGFSVVLNSVIVVLSVRYRKNE